MQTYFNREELALIQNRSWFETKASASLKTMALLDAIDRQLKSKAGLTMLISGGASKITKGENLKGFPYFVLDIPKLKDEDNMFSIRIIVWWGNYISVNLLLGKNVFKERKNDIAGNIALIRANSVFINIAGDHWQHDVSEGEHYASGNQLTLELLDWLNLFKASLRVELTSANVIGEVVEAVGKLNEILL